MTAISVRLTRNSVSRTEMAVRPIVCIIRTGTIPRQRRIAPNVIDTKIGGLTIHEAAYF